MLYELRHGVAMLRDSSLKEKHLGLAGPGVADGTSSTRQRPHTSQSRNMHRKIRLLLTVAAIIGLVFGLALLVAPAPLLRLYGLTTDATGLLVARLLGVEFIGYNIVAWVTRAADPSPTESAPRALVRAHLVSETAGALVSASAVVRGLGNSLFWSVPALYGILAAAFLWATLALRRGQPPAA